MPSRTSLPIFSADVHLGQVRPGPADQQLQTCCHVGGLEHLALLLVGQVRRPAGRVGQHRRVGHLLDGVDHLPGVPLLQVGDDQRLVLGGELLGAVGGRLVVDEFGLHPERGTRAGHPGADPGAAAGAEHGGGCAAGEPADLLDGGDDAEGGIAILQTGGEQHLADAVGVGGRPSASAGMRGLRGVDGGLRGLVELDRHDHPGQHDDVGQREHGKPADIGHVVHPSRVERV